MGVARTSETGGVTMTAIVANSRAHSSAALLEGRIALITGDGTGTGFEIAGAFSAVRSRVAIAGAPSGCIGGSM
jgi:hypothetical protein